MPTVKWTHPVNGTPVTIGDEHEFGSKPPRALCEALLLDERNDKWHVGSNMTVTCGTGCARAAFIQRFLLHETDPSKRVAMRLGSALHEWIGRQCYATDKDEEWWVETHNPEKCEFKGKLFGIEMRGHADKVKRDGSVIRDWKFSLNGGHKWAKDGEVDVRAAQLNMLRMLMGQQEGIDVSDTKMEAVINCLAKPEIPFLTEEQVGEVMAGETRYGEGVRVKELFASLDEAFSAANRIMDGFDMTVENLEKLKAPLEQIANGLPMHGEKMWVNRKGQCMCQNLCEVKETCMMLVGGL